MELLIILLVLVILVGVGFILDRLDITYEGAFLGWLIWILFVVIYMLISASTNGDLDNHYIVSNYFYESTNPNEVYSEIILHEIIDEENNIFKNGSIIYEVVKYESDETKLPNKFLINMNHTEIYKHVLIENQ